jgi:hypothetical protein
MIVCRNRNADSNNIFQNSVGNEGMLSSCHVEDSNSLGRAPSNLDSARLLGLEVHLRFLNIDITTYIERAVQPDTDLLEFAFVRYNNHSVLKLSITTLAHFDADPCPILLI